MRKIPFSFLRTCCLHLWVCILASCLSRGGLTPHISHPIERWQQPSPVLPSLDLFSLHAERTPAVQRCKISSPPLPLFFCFKFYWNSRTVTLHLKKIRDSCVKYLTNRVIITVSSLCEILRLAEKRALRGLLHMNYIRNRRASSIFSSEMWVWFCLCIGKE